MIDYHIVVYDRLHIIVRCVMSEESSFSGFMPMIEQINLTKETSMLSTEGDLIHAHTFTIKTRDGNVNVFSITNNDLMRLFFLINKVISDT
jgi:hypothetical protein